MDAINRKAGMTMIELIVVIAIIMSLVALLMPAIMRSREAALNFYCLSELQTLGHAYKTYALDYKDGIVPMIRASSTYKGIEWYSALKAYGKDEIATGTYADKKAGWVHCPRYQPGYNSYAQNDRIGFKDFLGGKNYFPVKFSQIPNPNLMVLMCEHGALLHNGSVRNNLGKDWGQPHYNFFPTAHYGQISPYGRWYKGSGNFLFCDGHAESIHWQNNWLESSNLSVSN